MSSNYRKTVKLYWTEIYGLVQFRQNFFFILFFLIGQRTLITKDYNKLPQKYLIYGLLTHTCIEFRRESNTAESLKVAALFWQLYLFKSSAFLHSFYCQDEKYLKNLSYLPCQRFCRYLAEINMAS